MQIKNYKNGVHVISDAPNGPYSNFYWKNLARLSYLPTTGFSIFTPDFYQIAVNFGRDSVTDIVDEGNPVPVPGTDLELFDLLCGYFYAPIITAPGFSKEVVNFFGPAALFNESDAGKVVLAELPSAIKVYTIPAGLSKGWNVEVFKMYAGNTVTFAPGAGMTLWGATLVLTAQYSKMEVIVTTPTTAILNVTL